MDTLRVDVAPRMSKVGFVEVLVNHNSPAAPVAAECYDAVLSYGLDPAVALAFFGHESGFGLQGYATRTHNWGNLRWAPVPEFADEVRDGWAWFNRRPNERLAGEWLRSCAAWGRLIREVYIASWGCLDVDAILDKYAPVADHNVPSAYAAAVKRSVAEWAEEYPPEEVPPIPVPSVEERLVDLTNKVDQLTSRVDGLEADLGELEKTANGMKAKAVPVGHISGSGIEWPSVSP